MIVIKIFQGPGNQLFQYALGRAVAHRLGTELKLDLSWYDHNAAHRAYALDRFKIEAHVATSEEINAALFPGPNRLQVLLSGMYQRLTGVPMYGLIKEDLCAPPINPNRICNGSYLDGYFSSELFFADIAPQLRSELKLKAGLNARSTEWAGQMQATKSVALSIRRGDFVGNPLHDVCDINYFYRAIDRMQELVGADITLYIWSDDMDWVRSNFAPNVPTHLMHHNGPDHLQDLELMSHCKHHIIPNSTFSWWGAWLGQKPAQVVVAPERWLNSTTIRYNHYLPQRWVTIKN